MNLFAIILSLVVGGFILVLMNRFKLRFSIIWATTLIISLTAWFGILFLTWRLPQFMTLGTWSELPGLFGGPDWLILDYFSWPIAFSIVTICLAAVLTSLIRTPVPTWDILPGILVVSGVGLAAATAGSITALLFAWTALDIFGIILQISNTTDRQETEQVVIALSAQLFGTMLIILSVVSSRLGTFDLVNIPSAANLVIILGVGFRLGVLPIQPPLVTDAVSNRGIQTIMRLTPAAGALPLLSRTGVLGVPEIWETPILLFALAAGLYGAINWLRSSDETTGRPYWIIGAASLAVVAVVFRLPEAATVWGVSLVFGGGILFLREKSAPRFLWMYLLVVSLMMGIVFTPSWPFSQMIAENLFPWGIPIVLIASLLLLGYLKHAAVPREVEEHSSVAGIFMLYVSGLSLTFVSMFFTGFLKLIWGISLSGEWWPGITVLGIVVALFYLGKRPWSVSFESMDKLLMMISPALIYRILWRGYRLSSRGVSFISRVFEGQSAVLWAILLLAFLLAIFSQLGIGN